MTNFVTPNGSGDKKCQSGGFWFKNAIREVKLLAVKTLELSDKRIWHGFCWRETGLEGRKEVGKPYRNLD